MPVRDIRDYAFVEADHLLLDTNILMFVYGPQKQNDKRCEDYTDAFKRMCQGKSVLYIDVLIMSEFINRCTRLEMQLRKHKDYKKFRNSEDFRSIAQGIASNVRRIGQYTTRTNSPFQECPLDQMLYEFEAGQVDFNDQMLLQLCRNKNLMLVTDDGDCTSNDVTILTANSRLLELSGTIP